MESPKDKDGHEEDFFNGIDTTLPGLADRLGDEEKKAPWLRPTLIAIKAKIDEATRAADKNPSSAATPLGEARGLAIRTYNQILGSQLSVQTKKDPSRWFNGCHARRSKRKHLLSKTARSR